MRVMSMLSFNGTADLTKRGFWKDDKGSVSVLTLCLLVLMLMMGGIAVDLMRYENTRVALQQTMDRSVLAASSLEQTMDPKSVVIDYFAKAGLGEHLDADSIVVTQGMNSRKVVGHASAISENYFMHMMGIDELVAPASAGAEQRRTNVEIMLVLDVSGSMTTNDKIGKLRTAASAFVDTVLAEDVTGRVSIGIVPYNAQVNLGSVLRQKYNASYVHGVANVNCLEVPASTYSQLHIPTTLAIPMSAYADTNGSTNQSTSYVARTDTSYATNAFQFCNPTTANIVRLPTNNIATLKSNINGLTAGGNTSIMLGMRWGVALLDPQARTMYGQLSSAGHIPAVFNNRPYDYDNEDAMKVIVLMTDGEHVAHTYVRDTFKTALSPIYRSTGDGNYSIRHTSGRPTGITNQYFVPHLCVSTNCRNGTNVTEAWKATAHNSGAGVSQQTWTQVWSAQRQTWVAWQLYARALGTTSATRTSQYTSAMNNFRLTFASAAEMDSLLQQSCELTKDQDVIVYGIAFEAPSGGQAQIESCASSPKSNHYFNATGLNISSVFQTIAANISQLRLTQ